MIKYVIFEKSNRQGQWNPPRVFLKAKVIQPSTNLKY